MKNWIVLFLLFVSAAANAQSDSTKTGTAHGGEAQGLKISKPLAEHDFAEVFIASTDADLEAAIAQSKSIPVIVDFTGMNPDGGFWCPPCKTFHPKFEEAAKTFKGKVRFVAIPVTQTWSQPRSGAALGYEAKVQAVPTILVYNKGTHEASQRIKTTGIDVATFVQLVSDATGVQP